MSRRTPVACLLLTLLWATPITAQDAMASRAVVDSVAVALRDLYVFPERGASAARALLQMERSGRFRRESSPGALAEAITREVRALIEQDIHFAVLAPESARANASLIRSQGGTGTVAGPIRMSRGTPPPGAGATQSEREDNERRLGHFFREVRRLPGNVLVIDFEQFAFPSAEAYAVASAVMQLAATADAVIFDVRLNRGGTEGLNQYIASHFFREDSNFVLYSRYQRRGDVTVPTRVLPRLTAPRMPDVPLFIVVDPGTGSAAENFAYTLQQHRRATIVGERTAGGAHSSQIFGLPEGFAVQLPTARVIHPVSRTNWEGTGVTPDVAAAQYTALDSAYTRALAALRQSPGTEARVRELRAAEQWATALSPEPTPSSARALEEYAGRYGLVEVRVEQGRLVSQAFGADGRPGATLAMEPRGSDLFVVRGLPSFDTGPVRFNRDANGRVVSRSSLSLLTGEWTMVERQR